VDWSLLACGTSGHVTYAPAEAAVRRQLRAPTGSGEAWRCLRCGTFVPGEAQASGPAAQAPAPRRDKEVRSAIILRVFAVERFVRGLAVAALAVVVWRFEYSHLSVEQAFERERPVLHSLFEQLGINIDHSKLVGLITRALTLSPTTLRWLAVGLAVYAVIELIEGTGLWLAKRWGEYFAMVATSLGLPYEIYELITKVTVFKLALFGVNLLLVLYLVITRRLFGVRGGKQAYEARLRSESIMDAAISAAAAQPDPAAGPAPPATAPVPPPPPPAAVPLPPAPTAVPPSSAPAPVPPAAVPPWPAPGLDPPPPVPGAASTAARQVLDPGTARDTPAPGPASGTAHDPATAVGGDPARTAP
jgi:uncharacterized membrane protein (DUF2068 family)